MFTGPNIVKDGLVLHLDAANVKSYPGSGTTWLDKSGNGNNGILVNGPTFNSGNGGSIVFDGVNDCVKGQIVTLTNYTISCWFKRSGIQSSNFPALIAFGTYNPAFYLEFNGNSNVSYYQSGLGFPNSLSFFSLTNIPSNTWVNLVFIKNGSTISSYLNSIFKSSITDNTTTSNTFILNGDKVDGPNSTTLWGGSMAQTQIYNRALSAAEILQNYNATKSRFGL